MSAKLLLATAVVAMGSFTFMDTAEAQRRGGAERGGNGNVEAGERRRDGARQGRGNRQAGQAQGRQRTARTNANRTPRANNRQAARIPQHANRNPVARGWKTAQRYAQYRWHGFFGVPAAPRRGCFAVARRAGGEGRRLRGISGEGFGRRACRKALNRCDRKLARRQASGRNPYARCVVASR